MSRTTVRVGFTKQEAVMPFSEAGLNIATNAVAAQALRMRTHTGDPGAAGTSNGGTGAAQPCAWASASGGEAALSAPVAFSGLAASEAVTWFSVWNEANSTFLGRGQVTTGDVAANAAGEYTFTTGTKLTFA
jgi:hypothetical protein